LVRFLSELGKRVGPENGMGSRGVFFALERLGADLQKRPIINRLVLLAPDFDSATFVDLLPRISALTSGITLYASSNDTSLKVSRQLNGHTRLGEAAAFLTVVEGVETIDVSPVGRYQILAHGQITDNAPSQSTRRSGHPTIASAALRLRAFDRDLICAEHYGQQPSESAASKGRTDGSTDQHCITVQKTLANWEPSTDGYSRTLGGVGRRVRSQGMSGQSWHEISVSRESRHGVIAAAVLQGLWRSNRIDLLMKSR
jgi:hypothetical protein